MPRPSHANDDNLASLPTRPGDGGDADSYDLNTVEERLRGLMGRQENRSEFLNEQEDQWRQWQAQKRLKKAESMSRANAAEIERDFARTEGDLGVVEDPALRADTEAWGHSSVVDDRPRGNFVSDMNLPLRGEDDVAEGGVNFKSDAKERKQQRRMRMIAKSVRVHLTRALRSGHATKRRPDLKYLASEVRITEVVMSSDVGHASILWTPLTTFDQSQVDKIEQDLNALAAPLRSGAAAAL